MRAACCMGRWLAVVSIEAVGLKKRLRSGTTYLHGEPRVDGADSGGQALAKAGSAKHTYFPVKSRRLFELVEMFCARSAHENCAAQRRAALP